MRFSLFNYYPVLFRVLDAGAPMQQIFFPSLPNILAHSHKRNVRPSVLLQLQHGSMYSGLIHKYIKVPLS